MQARGADRASVRELTLAALFALVMVTSIGRIVLAAVAGHSPVVPASPPIARWLRHIGGEHLTYHVFLSSLVAFSVGYAGLVVLARRVPTPALVGLIAVLYVALFIGPILVSTDVFSYIAYSRMGALHGLNPYTSAPFAIRHDPIFSFVGINWIFVPTAYGPLYTLCSYLFAPLGLAAALWGMKAVALAACVAIDWLTWRCALRRGIDPRLALIVVGASPLVVVYSLGSAQNDLLMIAPMMVGIYLALARPREPRTQSSGTEIQRSRSRARDAVGAAAVAMAALVKVPAGAVLPFMIAGRRRVSAIGGAAVALAVCLGVAYAVFGVHGANILSGVNRDSAYVSGDSFATQIAHMLGKPGVFPVDHTILRYILVLFGIYLLVRTWRGYDWVAASGWALLGMSVTATWLQPWYLTWPLPVAVISRDRRLLWATLFIQGLFIVHQLSPLFAPR